MPAAADAADGRDAAGDFALDRNHAHGVSWLGFFYGGNLAGAVFGCLLAGFYLLRLYDMATATFVAAAINGTVALAGAHTRRFHVAPAPRLRRPRRPAANARPVPAGFTSPSPFPA